MTETILVTGGAGFIGHHLVRRLQSIPKYRIVVVDNLSNANPFFNPAESKNLTFHRADIRNKRTIERVMRKRLLKHASILLRKSVYLNQWLTLQAQ